MIPYWPLKIACIGTFRYVDITPCLFQATFCTLTKLGQQAGGHTDREYAPLQSIMKGLN